MPTVFLNNFGGLNTAVNPLELGDGNVIQALNVTSTPFGAITKRSGYAPFLNNPDSAQVNTLFSWYRNDGTTIDLYRASGSSLYVSSQGTANWLLTTGGTIANASHIGHTVLNDKLLVSDGKGTTMSSTDGTTFTGVANAPISPFLLSYQNRAYGLGTGVAFAYSSANDLTNWTTGGTSDSATFDLPGEGSISHLFKNSDRVVFTMSGRQSQYQWDGFNAVDLVNDVGPSSPYSFGQIENLGFWLNHLGVYSTSGQAPQLMSVPIERYVSNNSGSGITGVNFGTAPGVGHRYDYLVAAGTTTDDFTGVTTPNAILKYDTRLNSWAVWSFHDNPTSWHSWRDGAGDYQLIFGDNTGRCFITQGTTTTTDNGSPIQSVFEYVISANTIKQKDFYNYRGVFNPGCEAEIEVAVANSLTPRNKKYVSVGQAIDGVVDFRIPTNMARGRFMFVKVSDNSLTQGFSHYGAEVSYDVVKSGHD